jgi:glycosyltransferase involved in cell wall biosynthesis
MLVKELIERRHRLAKSAWLYMIERSNLEGAGAIHATSELEAVELERFGWRLPHVAKIPNGVDEPEARTGEPSADIGRVIAAGPLALFLGRLSWKKGLDRLLTAFAPVVGGRLAIVGPDDEGLSAHLVQLATALGIGDRVFILPRTVLGCDKEYLFAAARVFVLPSYSENFGNTVLEAMRRAVPVIVTTDVGAAEMVRESGAGLVVEGAAGLLGAAISRLMGNEALARAMGESGQRHALAHCGWNGIAAQMEELYGRLRN